MWRDRRSIRLKGYDYAQSGYYFVTVCTHEREWLFGEIIDGQMQLNWVGDIINQIWQSLPNRFDIKLDQFQIMPNHIHGVIQTVGSNMGNGNEMGRKNEMGRGNRAPTTNKRETLGQMVAYFKYVSSKQINFCRGGVSPPHNNLPSNNNLSSDNNSSFDNNLPSQYYGHVWQRNYHEHIIRNERELWAIRQYIKNNPKNWDNDVDNL